MVRLLSCALVKMVTMLRLDPAVHAALYSRISYQRLGDKQGYFLQTSVGASGLCFGLQVSSFICSLSA